MDIRRKKKFLIIGLTGPVGSGCSSTANFLSGSTKFEPPFFDLLKEQTSPDFLNNLESRITNSYGKITNIKEKVEARLSKNLGPYKDKFINLNNDTLLRELNNKLRTENSKLKIYLRKREIYYSLRSIMDDTKNISASSNEKDKQLFGCQPFIYISISQIIFNYAIIAYLDSNGTDELNEYFSNKDKAFIELRDLIKEAFESLRADWPKYNNAIDFIKSRVYQMYFHVGQHNDINKIYRHQFSPIINFYFDFLLKSKELLSNIKELLLSNQEQGKAFSTALQDWGDNIRLTGNPFKRQKISQSNENHINDICNEINLLLKLIRYRLRYLDHEYQPENISKNKETPPTLFVIEAFRNPYEVDFFRSRYAEFYLFSIYASDEIRQARISNFSKTRDMRDQGENKKQSELFKLDVTTCVLISDIAVNNNKGPTPNEYFTKLFRYIALIWQPGCVPPNEDELFMHVAYSISCMSTCLSRRVGAVIVGPKGYIVGAGWNDVGEGQVGCGLRRRKDYDKEWFSPFITKRLQPYLNEYLDTHHEDYICYKDAVSQAEILRKLEPLRSEVQGCFDKVEAKVRIKRLEFCRALHAEENALLQLAKIGGQSVKGGIIYTTSFPCELCAKKIYQTGINRVVFTEPYPRSLAEDVFLKDGSAYIELRPFEGVKSNSFFKLFHPVYDKKDWQAMLQGDLH